MFYIPLKIKHVPIFIGKKWHNAQSTFSHETQYLTDRFLIAEVSGTRLRGPQIDSCGEMSD